MQIVIQQWPVQLTLKSTTHITGLTLWWNIECSECGPVEPHSGWLATPETTYGAAGSALGEALTHLQDEHSDLTSMILAYMEED